MRSGSWLFYSVCAVAPAVLVWSNSLLNISWTGEAPSYCVDPVVWRIFRDRIETCTGGDVVSAFAALRNLSASDFTRSHELLAHEYFSSPHNPHRVERCADAQLEYVPLLPLAWTAGIDTGTACTAGQ